MERIKNGRPKMQKKLWYVSVLGMLLFLSRVLTGCNARTQESGTYAQVRETQNSETTTDSYSSDIFAMDTYMTITAYGEAAKPAVEAAIDEIQRLDQLLSPGTEISEIVQINQNQGGIISEDGAYLIQRALEIHKSTGGVFDISVYPLVQEWGFTTGEYKVPTPNRIAELLNKVDASEIHLDQEENLVSFGIENMGIDVGGIAKGYTSARIMEVFQEYGVQSGLVSLGGNVQVLGSKVDGSKWNVAIENPEDTSSYLGVLKIKDRAVITSGGYERYFEEEGVKYHHILDPRTGYPAESGLTSVTIVSEDGTLADGLSTSLFVMGKDKAITYWTQNSEKFDFILETEDGKLLVSEGIKDQLQSDYEVTMIERAE